MSKLELIRIDQSGYWQSTFDSNLTKIARNSKGILLSYLAFPSPNYDANVIRFVFVSNDLSSWRTVYQVAGYSGNTPVVAAASTGEFFAILNNDTTGLTTHLKWADILSNPTPVATAYASHAEGKFDGVWDDVNRYLYYIGYSGYLRKFDASGALVFEAQKVVDDANPQQYPALHITSDGKLHLLWMTLTGNNSHYRALQYMVSSDGGVNFNIPGGSNLPLPVASSEAGASLLITPPNQIGDNSYIFATYVDDTKIHGAYARSPGFATRFFANLNVSTNPYMRSDRVTGAREIFQPQFGQTNQPKSASGGFFKRGGSLYLVTCSFGKIFVHKWNGTSGLWEDYFSKIVPNANVTYHLLHSLGLEKGGDALADVVGTFTNISCSGPDFSNGVAVNPLAEVYLYRFTP